MFHFKKNIPSDGLTVGQFIKKYLNEEYHALRVNDLETNDELLYIDDCYLELGDLTLKEVESIMVIEAEKTNYFYGIGDSITKHGYNVTVKKGL